MPQRPQLTTAKQNKLHMIRAAFLLAQMHEKGVGVPQDLHVARRQLNRLVEWRISIHTYLRSVATIFSNILFDGIFLTGLAKSMLMEPYGW